MQEHVEALGHLEVVEDRLDQVEIAVVAAGCRRRPSRLSSLAKSRDLTCISLSSRGAMVQNAYSSMVAERTAPPLSSE